MASVFIRESISAGEEHWALSQTPPALAMGPLCSPVSMGKSLLSLTSVFLAV